MNKTKNTLSIALMLVMTGMLPCHIAHAAKAQGRGPIPFSTYDRNGDGMISKEEFKAVQQESTESAPSGSELPQAGNVPLPAPVPGAGMPVTATGTTSSQQNQAQQQNQIQQQNPMQQQNQMQQQIPAPQQGMKPGMARGRNMPAFSDYDIDGNGMITSKEFYTTRNNRIRERAMQGRPMKNMGNLPSFASIDTNGDKEISPQEFAEHQARHQSMWAE